MVRLIAGLVVACVLPVVGCATTTTPAQATDESSPAEPAEDLQPFCNDASDSEDLQQRLTSAVRLFFRVLVQRNWWPPDEYADLDTGLLVADVVGQTSARLQQKHPGGGPILCSAAIAACQQAIQMSAGKLSWPLERFFKWGEPPQLLAAAVEFVGCTGYVTPH